MTRPITADGEVSIGTGMEGMCDLPRPPTTPPTIAPTGVVGLVPGVGSGVGGIVGVAEPIGVVGRVDEDDEVAVARASCRVG